MNRKCVIVAGMHRSGTSLLSSYLKSRGLHFGDNLLKGGAGNVKGHFEDLRVLEFHTRKLSEASLNPDGYVNHEVKVEFTEDEILELKNYLDQNSENGLFAWKEPRGTLFLEEWRKRIGNVFVIAIYRPVDDVVYSLYRRYVKQLFSKKSKMKMLNRIIHVILFPVVTCYYVRKFARSYCVYNRNIIFFCGKISKTDVYP